MLYRDICLLVMVFLRMIIEWDYNEIEWAIRPYYFVLDMTQYDCLGYCYYGRELLADTMKTSWKIVTYH